MQKTILAFAAVLPFACNALPAQAMSAQAMLSQAMPTGLAPGADAAPNVTLVSGGCGFGFHRGPYGGCRPNGFFAPGPVVVARRCPPGYHLGPYGRACRPNY